MTAAVFRSGTPALVVPHTQNTAPVLEFNCLYTHDIRRKQKRWQDGFLRFHTFNKRVMVYDVPRNFIGDMHWKDGDDLQDGDEVMLEKGGVLVQVAEQVGRTETDLTDLRKSKNKKSSDYGSSSPVRPARSPAPTNIAATASRQVTHLKHRSLNALLGTPKGPIGKAALPTKSPFEQRHVDVENGEWTGGRPQKKQRVNPPPAWNVTRTTTNPKPVGKQEAALWPRTADFGNQKENKQLQAGQKKIGTKEVIDLSIDSDEPDRFLPGFSSDALAPSSPQKPAAPVQAEPVSIRSSSPAFQTMKLPAENKRHRRNLDTADCNTASITAQAQCPVAAPLPLTEVYAPQRKSHHNAHPGPSKTDLGPNSELEEAESTRPVSKKSGQTLRMMASGPKKKTLLCQSQLTAKPSRMHSANTELAIDALLDATSQSNAIPNDKEPKSQRRRLQERLERIDKKSSRRTKLPEDTINLPGTPPGQNAGMSAEPPQTPLEVSMLELAQLDQMIMPPQRPTLPNAQIEPTQDERQLRRVVSESHAILSNRPKRVPGAPVRFTPSPAKKSPTPISAANAQADVPANAIVKPTKPRAKKLNQRAVSLNTVSDGTPTVILGKPFQTPKAAKPCKDAVPEKPPDPWSREAFDLFIWRPPSWDEDRWCFQIETTGD